MSNNPHGAASEPGTSGSPVDAGIIIPAAAGAVALASAEPSEDAAMNSVDADGDGSAGRRLDGSNETTRGTNGDGSAGRRGRGSRCRSDPAVAALVSAKRWDDLADFLRSRPDQAASVNPRNGGKTPLHLACEFSAPPAAIEAILAAHPDAARMRDSRGRTPLHLSLRPSEGCLGAVRALTAACPKCASVADEDGELPLHRACIVGSPPSVLGALVEAYYDPRGGAAAAAAYSSSSSRIDSADATTPLDTLPLDAVGMLFNGGPEIIRNRIGTALHWAIRARRAGKEGSIELETLMASYPDAIRTPDGRGRLPLSFALMLDEVSEAVQTLLDAYPEAAAIPDGGGRYALHHACSSSYHIDASVFAALMNAFPDGPRRADRGGLLPLHYALGRSMHLVPLHLLVRAHPGALTVEDRGGRTPLDDFFASAAKYVADPKLYETTPGVGDNFMGMFMTKLRYLAAVLLRGVDPDVAFHQTDAGINLLHMCYALPRCPVGVLRYVAVKNKDLISQPDDDGLLPLHVESARARDTEVDGMFINGLIRSHPGALRVRDPAGAYPLHRMIRSGRTWKSGVKLALLHFPRALAEEWLKEKEVPFVLARLGGGCDLNAVYTVFHGRPDCCHAPN